MHKRLTLAKKCLGDERLTRALDLYVSVFVASLGLGTYTYFIPVFAQALGASFLDLGLIGAANTLAYAVTPLLTGYLADRFNRAWIFTAAIVINVGTTIVLALANSISGIILIRLVGGFGYGLFWPVSEVLVTDLVPVDVRVKEMGLYSVAWASGFLMGPVMGGFIVHYLGFTLLFVFSSLLVTIALLPDMLWLVPRYHQRPISVPQFSGNISTMRKLAPWYMMAACYGVVFGVVVAIFPGYANSVNVQPEMIGLLFTVFGIARVFTYATSEWYLKLGEKKALVVASGIIAVGIAGIAIFPVFEWFMVSMVVLGGCFGVIFPLAISLISRHFPHDRLGAAVGSYETAYGIGSTAGPLLAGAVAAVNVSFTFISMSSFGVLMMIFALLGRTYPTASMNSSRAGQSE
jgi:MFS family permease